MMREHVLGVCVCLCVRCIRRRYQNWRYYDATMKTDVRRRNATRLETGGTKSSGCALGRTDEMATAGLGIRPRNRPTTRESRRRSRNSPNTSRPTAWVPSTLQCFWLNKPLAFHELTGAQFDENVSPLERNQFFLILSRENHSKSEKPTIIYIL